MLTVTSLKANYEIFQIYYKMLPATSDVTVKSCESVAAHETRTGEFQ